jgi:Fe-S oxidoreductase
MQTPSSLFPVIIFSVLPASCISSFKDVKIFFSQDLYEYNALDTCAADGMCAEKCPVNINTGRLVKDVRASKYDAKTFEYRAADVSVNIQCARIRACVHNCITRTETC